MAKATTTPKPVSPAPVVTPVTASAPTPAAEVKEPAQEMVTIVIDPEETDGGIMVNGKMYVGKITVSEAQADDLLRIASEYSEQKKKILNPKLSVRMKNDFQKEALFLADPATNMTNPKFSRDYGLLGAKEWSYCSPVFKQQLLDQRKALYGY